MENFEKLTLEQENAVKNIISESKKLIKVEGSILLAYLEAIGYEKKVESPLDVFKRLAGLKADDEKG